MDLIQIRYFLTLARTLNFTRAAEVCNVTQPALTKSIQRLEDELGGPLLLRERSLTQLTELGRVMLPLLEQTYAAAERAKEHATNMRKQSTASPLRVGFAPDVATEPFLSLFAEVAARLPGLELTLLEGTVGDLVDGMLRGILDVALVSDEDGLVERLNRWTLFRDPVVVVLQPGDALAALDAVPFSALAGRSVIGRATASKTSALGAVSDNGRTVAPTSKHGNTLPLPRHRAASAEHAMHLVRAGLGVALSTARAALDPMLLRKPFNPAIEHDVLLVAVAGRPYARAADGFIKLARARSWDTE